jgi:transporter family-2 protein
MTEKQGAQAMGQWIFLLMAVVAGSCLPLQAGINTGLARGLGHPISAALISFLAGTTILAAYVIIARLPLPVLGRLPALPWWTWIGGGFLGAYFVSATIIAAPRLGATVLVVTIIAGQVAVAMALDHKGWLGFEERPISLGRIAGIACLIVGVYLTRRF